MTAQELSDSLAEDRTKQNVDFLVKTVLHEPMNWDDWFLVFKTCKEPINWRMTWWLSHYVESDQQIGNFLQQRVWDEIGSIKHVSIERDFWKILTRIEINDDLAGLAYERAIKTIVSQKEEVAVRAYAMEVATNIACNWPDLIPEVVMILEDLTPEEPASIRARKKNFLKKLRKV